MGYTPNWEARRQRWEAFKATQPRKPEGLLEWAQKRLRRETNPQNIEALQRVIQQIKREDN
jgi:hypothetical protein